MMQLSKEPSSALSGTFSHAQAGTGEGNRILRAIKAAAFSRPQDGRRCRQADEGSF